MKGTVMSGMRPTGRLHIGHLSVLHNWVRLQEEYRCFFVIVDWHALTTSFDETEGIKENVREMFLDWLSVGLDPGRSAIFVQSQVKEHAELHLLLSMVTPVSWLERCPTYKEQIAELGREGKDISTYGFLGYPLLMAADILVYRADTVPVGRDQLPHLELCREVARRFNYLYGVRLLPEPQALLSSVPVVPGIDGRKMSKSYHNYIGLTDSPEEIRSKVRMMITDPARIRKTDAGHPEVCTVFTYQGLFNPQEVPRIEDECRRGAIGCVACKALLAERLVEGLRPVWEKRQQLAARPDDLADMLEEGARRGRAAASQTMVAVREAMRILP
ncbi:MAG: tryptophan--tRNA ligase [Syntrophomonadaceae bacterium]|nr:tryptophan--tRNA ligase [Syntrophomonadaceae bacterium]